MPTLGSLSKQHQMGHGCHIINGWLGAVPRLKIYRDRAFDRKLYYNLRRRFAVMSGASRLAKLLVAFLRKS
jgi:hypothetical protein